MSINPNEIEYVKNVSSKYNGLTLPYCQYQLGAVFPLDFPNNIAQPGNAKKLTRNDVILLYQKKKDESLKPKGNWLLTHLVQPEEDNTFKKHKNSSHPFSVRVKVIGKIPDGIDIAKTSLKKYLNLNKTSRGNACTLKKCIKRGSAATVQQEIINTFEKYGSVL